MIRFSCMLLTLLAAIGMSTGAVAQTAAPGASLTTADDSLYNAFGGKAGISKVIDDLLVVWQGDPRISAALKDADVDRLAALLKEQFTQLTGGPAVYSGKDMKTIHDGMGLRNAHFNALAEDLQIAMEKNGVPSRAQNKLLSKLAPLQRDIVTK